MHIRAEELVINKPTFGGLFLYFNVASLFVMMSLFHYWDHLLRIALDRAFSLTCVYACAVLNGAWLFIWKCFSHPCNILIKPNNSKLLGPPLVVVKLDKP